MVDQTKALSAADALKAAQLARKNGVKAADLSEFDGEGFKLVHDKTKLIGRGFLILSAEREFNPQFNKESYKVTAVTDDGQDGGVPIRFSDSSTGIFEQLKNYRGEYPLHCPSGLRVSEYNGKGGRPAKTFYIDTNV